jgi:hypothetical protein
MKAYLGEWSYSSTHSLTSALDGGEWPASRLGRFTPKERAPGTHWIGGWVDPRAVLDAVMKRKIPSPRRESNPRTPIAQPVVQRNTDWAITALEQVSWEVQKCSKELSNGLITSTFHPRHLLSHHLLSIQLELYISTLPQILQRELN